MGNYTGSLRDRGGATENTGRWQIKEYCDNWKIQSCREIILSNGGVRSKEVNLLKDISEYEVYFQLFSIKLLAAVKTKGGRHYI